MNQKGMSLVELMIAMGLGLMLTLAISTLFMQTRSSFAQDEQVATMQANLRFAMESIVRDAMMAGYWGRLMNLAEVDPDASLAIDTDCGPGTDPWAYVIEPPLGGVNNASAAAANAAFSCIETGEFSDGVDGEGTDVLAIKRATGFAIPNDECIDHPNEGESPATNFVYFAENGNRGAVYREPPDDPTLGGMGGCVESRLYAPVVYFIRNHSIDAGDGIPTLCRKYLKIPASGDPTMDTECLVEGIEQLQVEYGIDTNLSGVADRYVTSPTAAQFNQVTSIRIHLLARSLRSQSGYTNNKTYMLGGLAAQRNDSFYRRSATTTVVLRNPTNLRNLGLGG